MGQPTDGELWRLAADGEPDAFGVLFERHAGTVYNYLFRRTGDWAVAEDLTSLVFLEAWRRRRDVRLEHESALPWLYGVATNVLRNRRRAQRRRWCSIQDTLAVLSSFARPFARSVSSPRRSPSFPP